MGPKFTQGSQMDRKWVPNLHREWNVLCFVRVGNVCGRFARVGMYRLGARFARVSYNIKCLLPSRGSLRSRFVYSLVYYSYVVECV